MYTNFRSNEENILSLNKFVSYSSLWKSKALNTGKKVKISTTDVKVMRTGWNYNEMKGNSVPLSGISMV